MATYDAEMETDLFYATPDHVYRRGLVEVDPRTNDLNGREVAEAFVCVTFHPETGHAPEGTAEQIARALNRLPKLELKLIEVAQALRSGDQDAMNTMAAEIEDMICG